MSFSSNVIKPSLRAIPAAQETKPFETRFCIEALKTGKQMLGIADLGKVYDQIVLFTVLNKKI